MRVLKSTRVHESTKESTSANIGGIRSTKHSEVTQGGRQIKTVPKTFHLSMGHLWIWSTYPSLRQVIVVIISGLVQGGI